MNTVTGAHRGEKAVVAPVYVGVGGRAGQSAPRAGDVPLSTLTAKADGAIITPTFVSYGQQGGANRGADEPLHTATASDGDQNQIVMPTLIQTGYGERDGQEPRVPGLDKPLGTAVAGGIKHALVAPHLTKFRANSVGSGADEPVPTVTANSFINRPGGAAPDWGGGSTSPLRGRIPGAAQHQLWRWSFRPFGHQASLHHLA
jgi:DNA (cytosine-5)-methyltransferase 1